MPVSDLWNENITMNTIDLDTSNPNSTYGWYMRKSNSFYKEGLRVEYRNEKCPDKNLYLHIYSLFYFQLAHRWYRKGIMLEYNMVVYPELTIENPLGNYEIPALIDFYDENNNLLPEFEGFYDAEDRTWDPTLVHTLINKYI